MIIDTNIKDKWSVPINRTDHRYFKMNRNLSRHHLP